MKTTRFNAAVNGLVEKEKSMIRYNQVKNHLQSNTYDAEARICELEEDKTKIIKQIATGSASNLKYNLQMLADLIMREESYKEQLALGEKVLALLDEEIEVDKEEKK